jgi:hypothetical protein
MQQIACTSFSLGVHHAMTIFAFACGRERATLPRNEETCKTFWPTHTAELIACMALILL